MKALNKSNLELLRHQLLELQTEIDERLSNGLEASKIVTLDQTTVGRISRMDAMQQQNMAVSTRGKTKLRYQKVQAALRAMAANEYGYCRSCDESIPLRRLLAQPEATLCIRCQDHADRQQ